MNDGRWEMGDTDPSSPTCIFGDSTLNKSYSRIYRQVAIEKPVCAWRISRMKFQKVPCSKFAGFRRFFFLLFCRWAYDKMLMRPYCIRNLDAQNIKNYSTSILLTVLRDPYSLVYRSIQESFCWVHHQPIAYKHKLPESNKLLKRTSRQRCAFLR